MPADFPNWVGRVVDNDLPLATFVASTEHSAVFQTTCSGQNAALKLIAADAAEAEHHLARFELAARLSHPNLLRVLRFGRTQIDDTQFAYVVTEFAEENLGQVLPDRPLTKEETQQVLQSSVDALGYLHQQGLIHSDLKPANFMAAHDQLKLSIDGVHRNGEPLSRPTDPHDAPEASAALSPSADIWGLGITMVQMLTQQLPAAAPSANSGPAVPESVPAPFREIAQHCLLRTPELRWTLGDIDEKLNPKRKQPPAPVTQSTPAPSPKLVRSERSTAAVSRPTSKRPFIFVGIVAVIVALILAIPHFSHQQTSEQVTSTQTGSASRPQTNSTEQSAPAQASSSTPAPSENKESAAHSAAPPVTNAAKSEIAPSPKSEVASNVRHITDEPVESSAEPSEASSDEAPDVASSSEGVVRQVMPRVIRQASNTIHGTIRVKVNVNVDSAGNVVDSQFLSAGPSKYFSRAAMDAARQWKFAPASTEARAWNLEFDFRRGGTQVHSVQQK